MSKKGNKARSELTRMLIDKDDKYLNKLKKRRDESKARVKADEKRKAKNKPKKDKGDSAFMQELKNVGPEFMHGVRREFKQIKSLFKKDKKKDKGE